MMEGELQSLTDLLKKTLFFFDSMTVEEIVPYVNKEMMKDYSFEQVADNVKLCLEQHTCFCNHDNDMWYLCLEGNRNNDQFYNMLLSKQKPLSLKEIQKINVKKKKKKNVAEEVALISDGRFVQLNNGYWGLTEWVVEQGNYSLKQLVIRALKMHPTGLSSQQVFDVVKTWRAVNTGEVDGILKKFPYFEQAGNGIWCYNHQSHIAYENALKRFLSALERQRQRWHRDRERWQGQVGVLQKQLKEINSTYKETAAALAQRVDNTGQKEQMMTSLAEKDLLLSLRKKEIFRYKEHLEKAESRGESILHQCRIWVQKARELEAENKNLNESLKNNQATLESLFTKLQHYKEKDRENKAKIISLKDEHSTKVAELQTEIVELKQKIERIQKKNKEEENKLKDEVDLLSADLKSALEGNEGLQKSLRIAQHDLNRAKAEYKKVESRLNHPVVRIIIKIFSLFDRRARQAL